MTNEQYFDYMTNREEVMIENEEIKKSNYMLVSLLIVATAVIVFKIIEERKTKDKIINHSKLE